MRFENMDEMNRAMEQAAKTHGWIMREMNVGNSVYSETHTFGFEMNYDHPEMGVMIPINLTDLCMIFGRIAKTIQEGFKYESGMIYDKVLVDRPVLCRTHHWMGKAYLRIIIPDDNGKWPHQEECDTMYKFQDDRQKALGTFDYKSGVLRPFQK